MILSTQLVPTLAGEEVSKKDYLLLHRSFECAVEGAVIKGLDAINISSTDKSDLYLYYFLSLTPAIKVWYVDMDNSVKNLLIPVSDDDAYTYSTDKTREVAKEKFIGNYQAYKEPFFKRIDEGMKSDYENGLYHNSELLPYLKKSSNLLDGIKITIDNSIEIKRKERIFSYLHPTISKTRMEHLVHQYEKTTPLPSSSPNLGYLKVVHRTSGAEMGIVGEVYIYNGDGSVYVFSLGRQMNSSDLASIKAKMEAFSEKNGIKTSSKIRAVSYQTEEELITAVLSFIPSVSPLFFSMTSKSSIHELKKRYMEIIRKHIQMSYEKDTTGCYKKNDSVESPYNIPKELTLVINSMISRGVESPSDKLLERIFSVAFADASLVVSIDYGYMYERWDRAVKVKEQTTIPFISKELFGITDIPEEPLETSLSSSHVDMMLYPYCIGVVMFARIEEHLKLSHILIDHANFARIPPDSVLSSRVIANAIMSKFLIDKGLVLPPWKPETKTLTGAYNKEPMKGYHKGVVQYDFTAMYPTIIRQFNISHETLLGRATEACAKGAEIDPTRNIPYSPKVVKEAIAKHISCDPSSIHTAGGSVFSSTERGVLPTIMDVLFDKRIQAQRKLKEVDEEIKRLMNE